jgi:hypothetical protein
MAELQTNLNISPFYDDYNEDKQYYRILFRPATAVQARELTQLQTILQKQVSRFGDSIYKDGTIIEGCNFKPYPSIYQAKFKDSTPLTVDFGVLTTNHTDLANAYLLVSNTTGLRASIFRAFTGAEASVDFGSLDTNRAYVVYLNSGNNAGIQVDQFSTTSEQIDVYTSTQDKSGPLSSANRLGVVYTLSSNSTVNALGIGYGMHVGTGVVYQKGFFLKTLPDNFIIREHGSNAAGIKIGFDTKEYVVSPVEDSSLYDNSIGSSNFNAPGAYRLKLVPEAIFYDASNNQVTIPKSFLPVVEFDGGDGRIVELHTNPQLSILGDTLATRTAEESGDYIVKPFQIDVTSHESNNQLFYYNASPGTAYVDGYRVELRSPRKIQVPRAITTNTLPNQVITASIGNYVEVYNVAGIFDFNNLQEIDIYDEIQSTLTLDQSRTSPAGNRIGKANIRGAIYNDGRKGTASGIHNFNIFNVRMDAGYNFTKDARSFYVDSAVSSYGKAYADIVLTNNKANIIDSSLSRALFDTGLAGVKRLTDQDGVNDTTFVYKALLTATLTPISGNRSRATFNTTGTDIFNYGIGTLTDNQSEEIDLMFAQDTFSNTILTNATIGGVSNTTQSNVVATSNFTSAFNVGQAIALKNTVTSTTTYHTITAINSSNSMSVTPNTSLIGNMQLNKFFKKGTHIDMSGSGNVFTIDTTTSAFATLELDPLTSSYDIVGAIKVAKPSATPIEKVVRKNTYIKIDCGTNVNGFVGPWTLGLPDVYKIANVHFGSTYDETNPDKKEWFDLVTGQTDTQYGLSKLVLIPRYAGNLTGSSKLLIKLNHFTANVTSTKNGFFSVDSYPIDDANPTNSSAIQTAEIPIYIDNSLSRYDLRNHVDFRSYINATATVATTAASATINPANNETVFQKGGAGAQFVVSPESNFTYDVEFYLPRIDTFLINRDGSLDVKQGIPSLRPQSPAINKTGMPIAEILVPPYPSLTFKEAE